MNINGKALDQCSDAEVKSALTALVAVIGAQELAEVQALELELLRRHAWRNKVVDLNR